MCHIRACLILKEGASPHSHRPHPVLFAIREVVGKELRSVGRSEDLTQS